MDITEPVTPPISDLSPQGGQGSPQGKKPADSPDAPRKRNEDWRMRIDTCKIYRRKLLQNWTTNIDYRRGKPFSSQTDEDRVTVNLDWSLVKSKQAMLFSQVPRVHIDHPPQTITAGPWLQSYEQRLNDTLITAGIETAMDECLPDVINAAGIGAILVSHEAITEDVEVPAIDISAMPPQLQAFIMQTGTLPNGQPIPMETVPRTVDHRYLTQRISPADLLWPINFTGADFDNAPWIGRSGRMSWAQAVTNFKLKEEDRQALVGEEDRTTLDRLTHDIEKDKIMPDEMVGFDEIWYYDYQYDSTAQSYYTIHRLVFLNGKTEPIIDEPWKGQQIDVHGNLIGSFKFPLRILTLTYITDETIPPSDSAIGRPQINEINKSRTQMILQRERSLPVRWFDINRVDPVIQQSLMRGSWQGMIPVQGQGTNVIGEVSRASFPQEDFAFDRIAKNDLAEAWQVSANQEGDYNAGRHSAAEANIVQANFNTRIGRERAKVSKFLISICEVLGGLLTIFEPDTSFGQGFDPAIARTLSYSILADATVLLDSNQRLQKLLGFLNQTAKSGWVNVGAVLKEIATLSGLDPNVVITPPQPKPPVEPNISLRLTGMEDLLNPLALAMLIKSGQAPGNDLINQAKQLIAQAVTPLPGQTPSFPGQVPGAIPGGMPPIPNQLPLPGAPPPPAPQPQPPMPPPPPVGHAHPNWTAMENINKRTEQFQK